jgi:tripartite-type tricarboxylate transporter receptor subunit TctC
MDFAKTDEQKQIFKLIFARQVMGRPFLAPPRVPSDRANALREAFLRTLEDPEFRGDAEAAQLEINPVSGEEIEKLVQEVYNTPKPIAAKAAEFIRH